MAALDRVARTMLWRELVTGFAMTFKYMLKRKVTLNYPYEKGPLSLAMVVLTAAVLVFFDLLPGRIG